MADMQNLVVRLEKAVGKLELLAGGAGCGSSSPAGNPSPVYILHFISTVFA